MFRAALLGILVVVCLYGIGLNPFYWFFVGQFIRQPSWIVFFEFIIAILISSATSAAFLYTTNVINAFHILRERFLVPGSVKLEAIDKESLKQLLPANLLNALEVATAFGDTAIRSRSNLAHRHERMRVFVRHYISGPEDYRVKAYTSAVGTSFIFLNDKPVPGEHPYARYRFLHELAHISLDGVALTSYRYRRAITAFYAVTISVVAGDIYRTSFSGWKGLSALIGLFVFGIYEFHRYKYFPILFETKADIFALEFIDSEVARKEIVRLLEIEYKQEQGHRKKQLAHRLRAVKEFTAGKILTNFDHLSSGRRIRSGFHYIPRSLTWNEPSIVPWIGGTVALFYYGFNSVSVTNLNVWVAMLIIWAIIQVPVAGIAFMFAASAQRSFEKRISELV